MKIIKNQNQYYLGSQLVPAKSDAEVKAFFKNAVSEIEIVSGQAPARKPETVNRETGARILNIEKKPDGYYLGRNKIGSTPDDVRRLFAKQNVELNFGSGTNPQNKRFFRVNKDNAGWLSAYDSEGYNVTPNDPTRSMDELTTQLKTVYGAGINLKMMNKEPAPEPIKEVEDKN